MDLCISRYMSMARIAQWFRHVFLPSWLPAIVGSASVQMAKITNFFQPRWAGIINRTCRNQQLRASQSLLRNPRACSTAPAQFGLYWLCMPVCVFSFFYKLTFRRVRSVSEWMHGYGRFLCFSWQQFSLFLCRLLLEEFLFSCYFIFLFSGF